MNDTAEREHEVPADERVIFLHGFSREEIIKIMAAVKAAVDNPQGVAFSMSTPVNLEWVIKDLVKEVREEHEYLRNNPPNVKRPGS